MNLEEIRREIQKGIDSALKSDYVSFRLGLASSGISVESTDLFRV